MIKLTINGYSQEIPETIQELTLDHYIKFSLASSKGLFEDCPCLDDEAFLFLREVLSYPEEHLLEANQADLAVFFSGFTSVLFDMKGLEEDLTIIRDGESDTPPPKKLRKGNQHFYLPEHLQHVKYAQWIDFQAYCRDLTLEAESIPYALAIFCLKKDEEYDSDLVEERANLFKQGKYIECMNVHAFFLSGGQKYWDIIAHYFHKTINQDEQQQSQEETNSITDGDSLETLSNLVKLNQLSQQYTGRES